MNVPGGTTPAEPKVIDMDVMRADLLQLAEEGDFQTIERVIVKVLGRRYHGCIRMHANHVPLSLPAASLPQDGVYATARPWAETRGPAFDRGYEAGVYVVVGPTPGSSPAFADFSDLGSAEWRATAGRQPTLTGFEKKNAGAAYRVGPETWSMKGVASAGSTAARAALARWNAGYPLVVIFQIGAKQSRIPPGRVSLAAAPAGTAAAPARAEQGGDEEPGPAPAPRRRPATTSRAGAERRRRPGPAPPRKNEPAPEPCRRSDDFLMTYSLAQFFFSKP
ncbi:hypothetical protein JL722_14623 [Aureococcus anophagefferens]|nr:hypothetical protein JL722_14623 [Aureococcus anophagefferens]